MGLSIHYSGYIFNKELLHPLIEEVTDICKTLDWKTRAFDDKDIKGVSFSPKGSEPVFLTFNNDGRTLSPINILAKDIYDGVQINENFIFTISTKTQYAGPDSHIAIIRLLKYLSTKYLRDFTLEDEGNYWETGDANILSEQFKKYNFYIDKVSDILINMKSLPEETPQSLADRIEKILKEKFKGFDEN